MKKMITLSIILLAGLMQTDALAMLRTLSKVSSKRVPRQRSFSHHRSSGYGIGLLKDSLAAIETEKVDMIREREDLVTRFYQFSDSPHFSKEGQEIAERTIALSMINQDKIFWQIGQHEALIGAAADIWEEKSKEWEKESKVRSDLIDVLIKENKHLKQTVVRARSSRFSNKENTGLKRNKMVRE